MIAHLFCVIIQNDFSNGQSYYFVILIINFALVNSVVATMLLSLNVDKQPMIPMAYEAINIIFHEPKDMFWTGRVMDILYDGIPIDCSNTEAFQSKAVCGVFESGEVKAIVPVNDTHFSFSLFQSVWIWILAFILIQYSSFKYVLQGQ